MVVVTDMAVPISASVVDGSPSPVDVVRCVVTVVTGGFVTVEATNVSVVVG